MNAWAKRITGAGRGAVATILVGGDDSAAAVMHFFRPVSKVTTLHKNRVYFGTWVSKNYQEDLVVTRINNSRFEIHCHGGQLAASTILSSFEQLGVHLDVNVAAEDEPDLFATEAIDLSLIHI